MLPWPSSTSSSEVQWYFIKNQLAALLKKKQLESLYQHINRKIWLLLLNRYSLYSITYFTHYWARGLHGAMSEPNQLPKWRNVVPEIPIGTAIKKAKVLLFISYCLFFLFSFFFFFFFLSWSVIVCLLFFLGSIIYWINEKTSGIVSSQETYQCYWSCQRPGKRVWVFFFF